MIKDGVKEHKTSEQVNLYATAGASAHVSLGYTTDHRVEFYVVLRPAKDEVAKPHAMLAFEAMATKVEIDHGHSVTFSEPLWTSSYTGLSIGGLVHGGT